MLTLLGFLVCAGGGARGQNAANSTRCNPGTAVMYTKKIGHAVLSGTCLLRLRNPGSTSYGPDPIP